MAFSLRDAVRDRVDPPPFEFEDLDGNTHELPNIRKLTGDQAARLIAGDDAFLEDLAPDAFKALRSMELQDAELVGAAWFEHSSMGKEPSES